MNVERTVLENETIVLRFRGVVSDEGQRSLKPDTLAEHEYNRPILVNMRDVTLLNSTGIGLLLSLKRQVAQQGGRLVLQHVPTYVRQVLDFMKLGELFTIAKSDEQAKEMLQ